MYNLEARISALEKSLHVATIRATMRDGHTITLSGKDPAMRLLRASVGRGTPEDEAILRDAVTFEEGGDHLCELAAAIFHSVLEGEHQNDTDSRA